MGTMIMRRKGGRTMALRSSIFIIAALESIFLLHHCNYAFTQRSFLTHPRRQQQSTSTGTASSLYLEPQENVTSLPCTTNVDDERSLSSPLDHQGHARMPKHSETNGRKVSISQQQLLIPPSSQAAKNGRGTTTKEAEQHRRAIEQVSGIMDLFNSTTTGDNVSISKQIVSYALEGLFQRVYLDQVIHEEILEQLESLIWRCFELNVVVPTDSVLETLWILQQRYYEEYPEQQSPNRHIGRAVHLLTCWSRWAEEESSLLSSPPYEYLETTFALARERNVTMSYHMWDLYEDLCSSSRSATKEVPREFFAIVLTILSYSPTDWKIRQTRVLQDLQRIQLSTNNSVYAPTLSEMEPVLWVASRHGWFSEATWLLRGLCVDVQANATTVQDSYLKAWFLSLCKTQERGSTFYLEKLLLQAASQDSVDADPLMSRLRHREYYNLVLREWANIRTAASGMRAQALFERMVADYRASDEELLRPDEESIYHVVMAYLNEAPNSLQQALDANRFLHQAVTELATSVETNSTRRTWKSFDNVLEALSKHHYSAMAVTACEKSFRLFLKLHRDGRFSEEPTPYHLGHVLRIMNKISTPEAARISLNFFRLMDSLYNNGKIKFQPDANNIRQLLGTVALSEEPGHGTYAEELLDRTLKNGSKPDSFDAYEFGHLFSCVVRCHCNDNSAESLRRAGVVLDRLERLHVEQPTTVRVTGAAFKAILAGWAFVGGAGAGEQSQRVLQKMEQQYFDGNNHVKLTWDLYADAMKAWTRDPHADALKRVEILADRWKAMEHHGVPDAQLDSGIDTALAVAHCSCPNGSLDLAQNLIMTMSSQFEAGDDKMRVPPMAWHALLDATSRKSPSGQCVQRSLQLFKGMRKKDRLDEPLAKLRSSAYESLMRAWLRSGDPKARSEIELLYHAVMSDSNVDPTIAVVDLLLESYNEMSYSDDAIAEKALAVFQNASRLFREGRSAMKPGRGTVWLVLAILGRSQLQDNYNDEIEYIVQWRDATLTVGSKG